MARYKYQGTFKDHNGAVVGSATTANSTNGTISVYLAGTSTAASVYTASSGGTAVNSVSTDSYGHFYFWIDDGDYGTDQQFKITLSHTDVTSKSYDNLVIFPVGSDQVDTMLGITTIGKHLIQQATAADMKTVLGNYESSAVNFAQAGTGAATVTASAKLRRTTIDPYDFGCTPGTAADQTTNFQKALNEAASTKIPLDLCGQTWRIDSTLTIASDTEIRNGVIDFSDATAGDTLFEVNGTLGSSVAFSACSRGAGTITVSDATGLAKGDILYLQSSDAFGSGGTTRGEFIMIRDLSGTTVTPYALIRDTYTTTPVFYKPTMLRNIRMKDLRLIGGGTADEHIGVMFYLAHEVDISNVVSESFCERHLQFQRCMDCSVSGAKFFEADKAGLAYGVVVVNGCLRITISNSSFRAMRHGVVFGGNDGVCRFCTVTGCTCTDMIDAGLDSHPQTEFITFTGNTIGADASSACQDGIMMQGASMVCTNNVITGFDHIGNTVQDLTDNTDHEDGHHVIANNTISFPTGSGPVYGIFLENQRTGDYMRASITGNVVDTTAVSSNALGIYVNLHADGSTIYGLSIIGNTVYTRREALTLYAATSKLITRIAITGNVFETIDTTTYNCIQISSVTANYITRAIIAGNSIYGGKYGIDNTNGQRIKADANMIQGFGTSVTNGTIVGMNDNYSS